MQMTSKMYQDFLLLTKQSFLIKTTRNLNNLTKIIILSSELNLDLMSISVFGIYGAQIELGSVDWGLDSSRETSKICAYINWKLKRSEAWTAVTQSKNQKSFPTVIWVEFKALENTHFTKMGLASKICLKNVSPSVGS